MPTAFSRANGPVRGGFVAIVALALVLFAGIPAAAQDATETPGASPTVTPAADAPRIEIEFTELNDSGVTGTATLYESGEQTIVELDLEGTGDNHPAHIHQGTCEQIQPESAFNLENVGADGTSTSVVDAPLEGLINGDYVIDLHLAPNQLGTLIACADIEGTPEVPGTGGDGTPEATATAEATTEETATAEPTATTGATSEPSPTPEPTTEPSPTPSPTEEPSPTPTPEPTATEATDGTGGMDMTTPSDGTGADQTLALDSGKGVPVTPVTASGKGEPLTSSGTGGLTTSTGDGTQGGSQTQSGKGTAIDPATGLPESTGSGSSLLRPDSLAGAILRSMAGFSMVLAMFALFIRRGEQRRATVPVRWRRLGL